MLVWRSPPVTVSTIRTRCPATPWNVQMSCSEGASIDPETVCPDSMLPCGSCVKTAVTFLSASMLTIAGFVEPVWPPCHLLNCHPSPGTAVRATSAPQSYVSCSGSTVTVPCPVTAVANVNGPVSVQTALTDLSASIVRVAGFVEPVRLPSQ